LTVKSSFQKTKGLLVCKEIKTTNSRRMANTYTQIYIQAIFAVKGRQNLIIHPWRDHLHKYIAGSVRDEGAFPLAVGGWQDHVHAFFGLQPTMCISDLLQKIKAGSSGWINREHFVAGKFNWQSGYGAFSYSRSHRDRVIKYIMNQERHHASVTFKEEYLKMLHKFSIEYDEKYLFDFYEY
jgi:REP element-mobilizing transposase RayT